MEFCENQTLRQLIDSGELAGCQERVWRLFREVVEGLEHIHSKVGERREGGEKGGRGEGREGRRKGGRKRREGGDGGRALLRDGGRWRERREGEGGRERRKGGNEGRALFRDGGREMEGGRERREEEEGGR